ncbi:MAG: HEAT repeat domain-containing protein [Myxococcota bacterium]
MLLTVLGCTSRPERATVQRVVLSLPPSMDGDAQAREKLRADIYAQLKGDDLTRITDDARSATHLVRVEVMPQLQIEGNVEQSGVVVQLRPVSEGAVIESVGYGNRLKDNWPLEAFQDAWAIVTTRRMLRVARESDVLAALDSSDPRVRAAAIGLIGERKLSGGTAPLIAMLSEEENELLVLRAVGALISLGDEAAIDPLISLAKNKSPAFVLQVVFAVGAIGGRTAEGYLVTLAGGHPVQAVRQGAKDALNELGRAP